MRTPIFSEHLFIKASIEGCFSDVHEYFKPGMASIQKKKKKMVKHTLKVLSIVSTKLCCKSFNVRLTILWILGIMGLNWSIVTTFPNR